MVPRERELVTRLANQPFTLVGVNGDEDRGRAKTATADEKMTWRSFWDGAPTTGRIVNRTARRSGNVDRTECICGSSSQCWIARDLCAVKRQDQNKGFSSESCTYAYAVLNYESGKDVVSRPCDSEDQLRLSGSALEIRAELRGRRDRVGPQRLRHARNSPSALMPEK
jgi:hypothetical protein